MHREDIIATVRGQAGLASDEQAEAGLRAVLAELGERLTAGAADTIAACLPGDLAAELGTRRDDQAQARTAGELGEAVASRLGLDDALAGANVVQAAMRAVATAVDDPQRLAALRGQLPPDLQRMLLAEEEGDTTVRRTSVEAQRK